MKVNLLYHTPDYHKLVETVARVCYQSYHKDDLKSHNFIKAIMSKGHISVASVGNMVFEVQDYLDIDDGETNSMLLDLMSLHEITPFIKWTIPDVNKNPGSTLRISMNMLTLLDIRNEMENVSWLGDVVFDIFKCVDKVPCLKWFYDKSVELPEKANRYTALGAPALYESIVLDEDWTKLKALGLNDYELGHHATITMNFTTDRSASLQFWRHWSGGCELSQRYVERGDAKFREMIGIDTLVKDEAMNDMNDITYNYYKKSLKNEIMRHQQDTMRTYEKILDISANLKIRKGRAKEIARSVLPNSICTQLIQCRPFKNWEHLFKLRDTNHAQAEIRADVVEMKNALRKVGVEV